MIRTVIARIRRLFRRKRARIHVWFYGYRRPTVTITNVRKLFDA